MFKVVGFYKFAKIKSLKKIALEMSTEENIFIVAPSDNQSDPSEFRSTLISNDSRVYKGGSWLDRSYYLDPAQRRFFPEYMTTNYIGFRCAMSYLGESRNATKPKKR